MIDKSKTYRTRDGREVRIYATDGVSPAEIHGSIKSKYSDGWHPYVWQADGKHHRDHVLDLIEVRPCHKRTVWLNIFADGKADGHSTYELARSWRPAYRDDAIACIKVELDFEEGEGL